MRPARPTRPSSHDWLGSAENSKNNCSKSCAMKTNSDPERDDALLDAMLQDETWQTASAGYRAEALRTCRTRHRVRRLPRWAGGAAALAAAPARGMHCARRPAAD